MTDTTKHTRILWGAGSSRPLRALWMLHELELPFEHRPIRSRSGETNTAEYTQLNPSEKIPTLQDGELTMSESAAIVNYLATAYGAAKNLAPPTAPQERARYDQWCFFVMMELDANTLYIIRRHVDLAAVYGEAPAAVQTARECYIKQAGAAAVRLADSGPYVLGARFTGADILLTSSLAGALKRDIALPARLHEYLALTTARPAYKRAVIANTPKPAAA